MCSMIYSEIGGTELLKFLLRVIIVIKGQKRFFAVRIKVCFPRIVGTTNSCFPRLIPADYCKAYCCVS
jgi:hypothetical protein